jgi:hypothetical protein
MPSKPKGEGMPKRKPLKKTVILLVVQGQPRILMDEELEYPAAWESIHDAINFTCTNRHLLVEAAESIMVVDLATGETETL